MIDRFKSVVSTTDRPFALIVVLNNFDGNQAVDSFLLALQQDGRLTDEISRFVDDIRTGDREVHVSADAIEAARILIAEKTGELAHDLDTVDRAQLRREYLIGCLMQSI